MVCWTLCFLVPSLQIAGWFIAHGLVSLGLAFGFLFSPSLSSQLCSANLEQSEYRRYIRPNPVLAETHYKTHWTLPHYAWLERTIEAASGSFKVNLSLRLRQLKALNAVLAEYEEQIDQRAKTP